MGLDNPLHILILLVVVLLVFGAKRLPEIGRSLGEGMRGFKDSISGESHADHLAELGSAGRTAGGHARADAAPANAAPPAPPVAAPAGAGRGRADALRQPERRPAR